MIEVSVTAGGQPTWLQYCNASYQMHLCDEPVPYRTVRSDWAGAYCQNYVFSRCYAADFISVLADHDQIYTHILSIYMYLNMQHAYAFNINVNMHSRYLCQQQWGDAHAQFSMIAGEADTSLALQHMSTVDEAESANECAIGGSMTCLYRQSFIHFKTSGRSTPLSIQSRIIKVSLTQSTVQLALYSAHSCVYDTLQNVRCLTPLTTYHHMSISVVTALCQNLAAVACTRSACNPAQEHLWSMSQPLLFKQDSQSNLARRQNHHYHMSWESKCLSEILACVLQMLQMIPNQLYAAFQQCCIPLW